MILLIAVAATATLYVFGDTKNDDTLQTETFVVHVKETTVGLEPGGPLENTSSVGAVFDSEYGPI